MIDVITAEKRVNEQQFFFDPEEYDEDFYPYLAIRVYDIKMM